MNPLLQQAIDLADQSIKAPYTRGYHAIISAGLKAMFSDKTFHYMKDYLKAVTSAEQVPEAVSHGIIKLLSIIWNESKGNMQLEPAGSAAIVLMAHALDYVESVMKIPIDKETFGRTTMLVNKGFLYFLQTASNLSDADFEKIMRGQGQEVIDAQQAAGGGVPQPGAVEQPGAVGQPTSIPAPPMQGAM